MQNMVKLLFNRKLGLKKLFIISLFIIVSLILCGVNIYKYSLYIQHKKYLEHARVIGELSKEDEVFARLLQDTELSIDFNGEGGTELVIPELRLYSYKVKDGDNLWVISKKTRLSIDTIVSANSRRNVNHLNVGETIIIPNRSGIFYKVKKGDTLDAIASKFNVTTELIEKIDKNTPHEIKNNTIKPNDILFLTGARYSIYERAYVLGCAFQCPVRGRFTSGFGYRRDPFTHRRRFHTGIDIANYIGTPVKSARAGRVIFAGKKRGYGNLIILKHDKGYTSYYGHLSRILVRKGEYVSTGHIIGRIGNTGRSTGPHLHFEIRRYGRYINPVNITQLKYR